MDEKDDDGLSLGLSLRLGCGENENSHHSFNMHNPPQSVSNQRASFNNLFHFHDRSSEMCSLLRGIDVNVAPPLSSTEAPPACDDENGVLSPNSTISSISGKRSEREVNGDENERESCSRGGGSDQDDGDNDGDTSRKKLRLSKEQALVLEETFKEHNTLNPKQKQALAKQLNLRPRQVEVWFQNRRARTKLKQTEVDCEYWKRYCENLTEENRRLQKEVQELRALKLSPQLYMHMNPPTTLTMCPSCERVAVSSASPSSSAITPSDPPVANRNPFGPAVQRPVPVNPWAAMSIRRHAPP
ncbi:homeobox-leucine zipper protein HAT3 [Cajanus cajan]|uniref:Homeobox-leucine zipper protein HAT3 n=1 Tax=Cajanus cajan TaxID=3821 RepID=A0A151RB95_CAJCA|nr:homeobox-leucine zipper protein HAT3 [Cajanus cajan]KYP39908.1 Homeobox-leucine zipper protein HAT3 [Cajanus cajan]